MARPGHSDRALDDLDIVAAGIDIALLEPLVGIALLRGNEARTHLYGIGAEPHDAVYILAGIDAAPELPVSRNRAPRRRL